MLARVFGCCYFGLVRRLWPVTTRPRLFRFVRSGKMCSVPTSLIYFTALSQLNRARNFGDRVIVVLLWIWAENRLPFSYHAHFIRFYGPIRVSLGERNLLLPRGVKENEEVVRKWSCFDVTRVEITTRERDFSRVASGTHRAKRSIEGWAIFSDQIFFILLMVNEATAMRNSSGSIVGRSVGMMNSTRSFASWAAQSCKDSSRRR